MSDSCKAHDNEQVTQEAAPAVLPQEDEESGAMEVPLHTAVRPIDASVASILRALLRTADFHKIRHGLYLGSLQALAHAEKEGFTHIISVNTHLELSPATYSDLVGQAVVLEHQQLVLSDVRLSNLLQHLPGTCDTIAAALAAGGKVLVHCFAGISRSTTVVAAHIMRSEGLSPDAAVEEVRGRRSCANPNPGFLHQLHLFHQLGCSVDTSDPRYKEFVKSNQGTEDLPDPEDVPSPSEQAAGSSKRVFRCKECSALLAIGEHVKAIDIPAQESAEEKEEMTSLVWLQPLRWMEGSGVFLGGESVSGPLLCSNSGCRARLGSYSWAGMRGMSGQWHRPGFQLQTQRLDTAAHGGSGGLQDIRASCPPLPSPATSAAAPPAGAATDRPRARDGRPLLNWGPLASSVARQAHEEAQAVKKCDKFFSFGFEAGGADSEDGAAAADQ